jgi:flagellar basal-body rod protein FlgB
MIRPIGDVTSDALRVALRGLDTRQKAIANNVANVETPNFSAQTVAFEDSLRGALMGDSDVTSVQPVVAQSQAPTRLNGNNVSLDTEILAQSETELRTKLVVQAINAKYALLRTAITGQ